MSLQQVTRVPAHAAPVEPPLNGRYPWVVAVALLALCPNIVLTTAFPFLEKPLTAALHITRLTAQTAEGLSNAGYAFGAVFAAFLVQRYRQRTLFVLTELLFVAGSIFTVFAWAAGPFFAGRVAQGTATGLMLVIALPPLIIRFSADRLPRTAAVVNVGLFGAVTIGPVLGGLAAQTAWRWLFGLVALLGIVGVALAALALPDIKPFDPQRPPDAPAFALAAAATVLPFFAVSQLVASSITAPIVWAPLAAGLIALMLLIVVQYRARDPLMPVRALSTSLPVIGTLTAMIAGAAFVTLAELAATALLRVRALEVAHAGLLFWPAIPGIAVAAIVFAALFRTRWIPLLVLAGLVFLIAGGVLLALSTSDPALLTAAGLLGAGAGATVSPGLFLAALGVPSNRVGRAFALVELLRSEAAYLVGPVLLYVAMLGGSSGSALGSGLRLATWITVGVTALGTVAMVGLFFASGARLHAPDLEAWLEREEQAMDSPPTAKRLQDAVARTPSVRATR